MKLFKLLWTTHKWTGIVLGIVFLHTAVTGFLLLMKKDYAAIQPPTCQGAPGELAEFRSLQDVFAVVFAEDHPDFQNLDDIDRIDFRPGKRVHKVRSRHNHSEIQVDAVTGAILSRDWRPSDLLEDLHDGSFYARWAHAYFMPLVAIALAFMVGSGIYIWAWPVLQRRKRRRAAARAAT